MGRVCGCVCVCVCVCVVIGDDKWELQGGGGYVGGYVCGQWLGMISGSYKEGEGMCVCVCGGWGHHIQFIPQSFIVLARPYVPGVWSNWVGVGRTGSMCSLTYLKAGIFCATLIANLAIDGSFANLSYRKYSHFRLNSNI